MPLPLGHTGSGLRCEFGAILAVDAILYLILYLIWLSLRPPSLECADPDAPHLFLSEILTCYPPKRLPSALSCSPTAVLCSLLLCSLLCHGRIFFFTILHHYGLLHFLRVMDRGKIL
jgi:hypothetical protein